jgi:nicotinate-nucleotide adenylyltransferase
MTNTKSTVKLGIYGGTFDPFHEGHLWVVEESIKQLDLDYLWIMPAKKSPFKLNQKHLLTDEERIQSIKLLTKASKYDNKISISESDMNRDGQCYTVETLKDIIYRQSPSPDYILYNIMGADAYCEIQYYKDWEMIFALSKVVVAPRNSYDIKARDLHDHRDMSRFFRRTIFLQGHSPDISSTLLRKLGRESWKK